MRIELNLLSRRPPKYGPFEIPDIVLMVFCAVAPMIICSFLPIPYVMGFGIILAPALLYVLYFRIGRRSGFFLHWLGWRMRARKWISGWDRRDGGFASRVPGWERLPRVKGGRLGRLPE